MEKEHADVELDWDRNGVRGQTAAPEGDHVLYPPPVYGFLLIMEVDVLVL